MVLYVVALGFSFDVENGKVGLRCDRIVTARARARSGLDSALVSVFASV